MGDDSVNRSLYVGGVTDNITEELLYELFLQAGPLESVKIASERDGRKKNFAFVNFKHEESVPYTIKLMAGIRLFGQPLRLQPRPGSIHQSQQRQNGPPSHMQPSHHNQFQQGRAAMHRSMSAPSMDPFGRRKMSLPAPSGGGGGGGGGGSIPGTPPGETFPNLPPPPRESRQDRERSHSSEQHRDRSNDRHRDSSSGDRHRDSRRDDRYRDSPGSSPRHSQQSGQQGGWQLPQFAPHQINVELARQRILAEQEQRRAFRQGQHGQYRNQPSNNQPGWQQGRRRH